MKDCIKISQTRNNSIFVCMSIYTHTKRGMNISYDQKWVHFGYLRISRDHSTYVLYFIFIVTIKMY